jgi:hypothetical protein
LKKATENLKEIKQEAKLAKKNPPPPKDEETPPPPPPKRGQG